MSPHRPSIHKTDKAHAILDHASQLLSWSTNVLVNDSIAFPDPELCIHSLPLNRKDVSPTQRIALEDFGVRLWNTCCNLSREDERVAAKGLVAKVRCFAYFLLESASRAPHDTAASSKAFRTGSRAAKGCLHFNHIDLAGRIIERLAEHQRALEDQHEDSNAATLHELLRTKAEFLMLRITLVEAWRQERLDMADHFHGLLCSLPSDSKFACSPKAADLFYDMGTHFVGIAQPEIAARWLRRAIDMTEVVNSKNELVTAADLRLNSMHTLVRALLSMNTPETGDEALQAFATLKQDYGHRLPVMLLEIELLTRDPGANPDVYFAVLSKVMQSVHIIESNHKIIMHYLHHLKSLSLDHAQRALKQYLVLRLTTEDEHERTEGAIITLIWMSVPEATTGAVAPSLPEDLDDIHSSWQRVLGTGAAHAAILLLWRRVDSGPDPPDEVVISFCQIALHPLLRQAGERNKAKLQRKLISCYISVGNLQGARQAYSELSEPAKASPLSNYLHYIIALRTADESAADEAVASLVNSPGHERQLLLACVGETMKHGSKRRGATLLQRVLDKYSYDLPSELDTCAVLRCTAQLHLSVLDESSSEDFVTLSMLSSIFRVAAAYSAKCNGNESGDGSSACPLRECEWFEKTSFNKALQHAGEWPSSIVIDLLAHSIAVTYPPHAIREEKSQKIVHQANSLFLQAILFTTKARDWKSLNTIEDIPRTSYSARNPPETGRLQCHLYQNSIERYCRLKALLFDHIDLLSAFENAEEDITSKTATLLPLAFEAHLFITLTDALSGLPCSEISVAQLIDDVPRLTSSSKPYALLADLVLSSAMDHSTKDPDPSMIRMPARLPLKNAINLLAKLVTTMRGQPDYDIDKAARWIRCIVQMVLDSYNSNSDATNSDDGAPLALIEPIVTEAAQIARSAAHAAAAARHAGPLQNNSTEVSEDEDIGPQLYPSDELQWLSTVLFNLAVDLYVADQGDEAQKWARHAVAAADVLALMDTDDGGDAGVLLRVLKERGARVGWSL